MRKEGSTGNKNFVKNHVLGGGVPASQPQTPPELCRLAFMAAACSDATAL